MIESVQYNMVNESEKLKYDEYLKKEESLTPNYDRKIWQPKKQLRR